MKKLNVILNEVKNPVFMRLLDSSLRYASFRMTIIKIGILETIQYKHKEHKVKHRVHRVSVLSALCEILCVLCGKKTNSLFMTIVI